MPTGLGDEKLWLCPTLDDSANDLSGNSNNGTYNGGMGTVADTSNGGTRAYSFDGVNDYIDTTLTGIADFGSRSITGWCNFSSVSGVQYFMNWYDSVGGPDPRSLYVLIYQNTHWFGWKQNSASLKVTGGTPATGWKHYCYVHDASAGTAKIYIDATLVASGSILNTTFGNDYAEIGRVSIPSSTVYTQFESDDIRIFDRALSTSEITHLATSRGIEGSPYTYSGLGDEKLWLCPSLDDSADDISGNGNHGTYNGGMGTVADTSNGGTRAYSFDGVNDYIDTTLTGIADFGSRSITGWCNFSSVSGVQYFMNWYDSVGGPDPRSLYVLIYQNTHWFGWKQNSASLKVTGGTPATGWKHYCYVHDASAGTAKIYIDATLVASGSILNTTFGNDYAEIGRVSIPSSTVYTQFESDDIRIFDRALSTSEITHLATSRGIEGSPYTYSGLGDEKLWLCPSLDDSADDISGNGNHGTYNGGMGTVADVSNGGTRAYSFDGVNDEIPTGTLSSYSFIQNTAEFAVSAWVKPYAVNRINPIIISTTGTAEKGFYFRIETSNVFTCAARLGVSGQSVFGVSTTATASVNQWVHVCCTGDGQDIYFYINGSLATVTGNPSASVGTLSTGDSTRIASVGRNPVVSNQWFYGLQDDIRIFDRALSTSEITALASKRGYEVPAASGSIPHALSSPFHPLG